jgi:hypothetical protein
MWGSLLALSIGAAVAMAVTAGSRVFATLAALSQIILFMENLKEYIYNF